MQYILYKNYYTFIRIQLVVNTKFCTNISEGFGSVSFINSYKLLQGKLTYEFYQRLLYYYNLKKIYINVYLYLY